MSGGGRGYVKSVPFGDFNLWVEREFEALERGLEDSAFGLRWDDLRFAAGAIAINPVGTVAAPSPDEIEADFPGTLLFAGNADNVIADVAQLPHSWKLGSAIKPHVHWLKKTASANVVVWEFYYRIIGNVGSLAGSWSTGADIRTRLSNDSTTTIGDQSAANTHLLTSFGSIDMTGYTESCLLAWRLYRRAGTNASDNDTNAVSLLSFDIHYQSDGRGSIPEYPV